jgi:acyl-CoA synthetase (AMP-forming)/AMP-acid ligase II
MTFQSPHADIPIPASAVASFVLAQADKLGDKPAMVDAISGRILTYAGLGELTRRLAAGLASRRLARGEVVGVCLPNSIEYPAMFHGVASLGAASTTMNPIYTAEEMSAQLKHSAARFLFTNAQLLERAQQAAANTRVEEIFVIGEAPATPSNSSVKTTPFATLAQTDQSPPSVSIVPEEDVAVLPYSSGTTGLPKGVMLTHRNLVANISQVLATQKISPDDRVIAVLPFFHIYGMTVVMNTHLAAGATVVTMPRFDLEQFLRTIEERRITRAYVAPPIVLALARHPLVERYDLSSLRLLFSGAAPLGAELCQVAFQRVGCEVTQGYGLSEASPVTHITPEGGRNKAGSIGPLAPNTEGRVVDVQTGQDSAPGETGEFWVRGPQVMKGYLNNPEATAATIDQDGWLHTGDIGYADADGYFFVVDRVKELIKYKGYQVAPAELESVLLQHPAIADAAVIPVPDEECGEVPKGCVVLKAEAAANEIIEFVAARVAPYKKIRKLEFVSEIPKSPAGKILRRVLIAKERDGGEDPGRHRS